MSRQRQKGTAAETAVVRFLAAHGFPTVERKALHGALDEGDLTGIPGVVIEVKNHAAYKFGEWMTETAEERRNARGDIGVLVVKPRGVGTSRTGEWFAVVTLAEMAMLLREAGWGQS